MLVSWMDLVKWCGQCPPCTLSSEIIPGLSSDTFGGIRDFLQGQGDGCCRQLDAVG